MKVLFYAIKATADGKKCSSRVWRGFDSSKKKNLKNAKIDSDLDRPRRRFFGLIRLDVMSNNCIIVEKEQLTIIKPIHGDKNYGRNVAEGFEAIHFR